MRVLFLSSIYPRAYDPTRGIYSQRLCTQLAAKHEVRVISPVSWVERLYNQNPYDASIAASVGIVAYPWYFYPPKLMQSRHGLFMWASIRGMLRRSISEFRPDCVLSYWAHPDGEVATRVARLAGARVGIMVGGSDILLLTRNRRRRRAIVNTLGAADAVFAVGQDLKSKVIQLGIDPSKTHVFDRGVDPQFAPGDRRLARTRRGLPLERNILLWVGRMAPVKGLEVLLQACASLRSRQFDFEVVLIGDGPLRKPLEASCHRLGLSERVRFTGALPHGSLPDWYRAADLTVLPSYSEGNPNVLRESLACGTPYVASRVGGVPEISDDPCNQLVPAGDSAQLAEAIENMLSRQPRLAPRLERTPSRENPEDLLRILRPDFYVDHGCPESMDATQTR